MIKYDRKKNTVRNIGVGILNKIITIGFPFVLRTIIIYTLGTEYLGLSSLFTSILQVLSLTELGIGNAMVFELYKPIANNDINRIRTLLSLYKTIYICIGGFIVLLGLLIMPFLPSFIHGSYPKDINLYILFLLYLFNSALPYFISAYKSIIISAFQRRDVIFSIGIFIHFALYFVQIICLLFYRSYYMYVIWLPVFSIIERVCISRYAHKNYKDFFIPEKYTKQDLKNLFLQVKDLMGHKLSNVVTNSIDTIVISAYLGLGMVTIYNNYYYLMSAVAGVLDVMYTAVLAGIGNSLVTESVAKNEKDFNIFLGVNSWIIGWCSICFLCLFQPMITLWVGSNLLLGFDTVVLLCLYFYIWKIRQSVLIYKDAAGIWHEDNLRPYAEIAINIFLNIVFVRLIGINGIVISTIISMVFVSIPWETKVFFNKCFHKSPQPYFLEISKITISTILLAIVTFIICNFVRNDSFISLLFKFVICVFVPNTIIVFFGKNNNSISEIISHVMLFINSVKQKE